MEQQGGDHHVEEVLRHSRALREEAGALLVELQSAADELGKLVDVPGRMERHPYLTMAAAAGIGYVLGGGLFTRMTGRLLRVGTRLVLLPLVRQRLAAMGQAAMGVPATEGAAAGWSGSEDGTGGL